MRSGKIEVVRHDGELLFKTHDGILVDLLRAHDFCDATISVVRNGIEFDKGDVREIKAHESVSIFGGMLKTLTVVREVAPDCFRDCKELLPEYFDEGDHILFVQSQDIDKVVDFRATYAEDCISKKLAEREDLLNDFVNDEDLAQKCDEHADLFTQEVANFVFPPNPILRRRIK